MKSICFKRVMPVLCKSNEELYITDLYTGHRSRDTDHDTTWILGGGKFVKSRTW